MAVSDIVNRVAQQIFGSSLAVKVERELTEERLTQRQAWVNELASLNEAELITIHDVHEPAKAQALAAVQRCQAAQREADEQLTAVTRAANLETWETDRERGRLETLLVRSASPLIAAFIATLPVLEEETGREIQGTEDVDERTGCVICWSNSESGNARLAAIRQARADAHALVFLPLSHGEVIERLAQIRDAIPEVGPMVRTVSPPRGERLRRMAS
jgi:hypothetical protein